MYQVYKSRRGIKRSEDSKVRSPAPRGAARSPSTRGVSKKSFLPRRLEGGLPGAGAASPPSSVEEKGQERVALGVTAALPRLFPSRGAGRRGLLAPASGAHRLPVRLAGDLQTAAPAHREKETRPD